MWTYRQSTGELLHDGEHVGRGYSGHGDGLNNPTLEDVPEVGPIPRGFWHIGVPHMSMRVGPYAMSLRPEPGTDVFRRSDFLIHGDNYHHDQSASRGCIVLARALREAIHESSDTDLEVI